MSGKNISTTPGTDVQMWSVALHVALVSGRDNNSLDFWNIEDTHLCRPCKERYYEN